MVETVYEDLPRYGKKRGRRVIQNTHHPVPDCRELAKVPERHRRTGRVEKPTDVLTVFDQSRRQRDLVLCGLCRMGCSRRFLSTTSPTLPSLAISRTHLFRMTMKVQNPSRLVEALATV